MVTKREASLQALDVDLDKLRSLKRRTEELAAKHLEALDVFHLRRDHGSLADLRQEQVGIGGFANFLPDERTPQDGTARESLVATTRCLRSLGVCRDLKRGNADYSPVIERIVSRYHDKDVTSHGLSHLNPFTASHVLSILRGITGDHSPEDLKGLVDEAGERLRQEVSNNGVSVAATGERRETEQRFPPHGYLTYWSLTALAAWDQVDLDAAQPSLRWSETALHRQTSLFTAGNDERSDAYQLGYNLLVQYRFNRFHLGDSLIDLALRTLFSAQLERGVWEKRNPLFRYGDRGEAYCFSFELLSTLLRQLRDEWEFFVPYELDLATALGWAERNALKNKGVPLWRSGHVIEEGSPESWATAEVYAFLQLYSSYLTWRIESVVLEDFQGQPGEDPDPQAFDSLYQPEIKLPGEEAPVLLADLLKERLLDDLRAPGERLVYSLVHHPDREELPRSGILFGPPGTGKTTYVKKIARYLGWPVVVLDPSDFASQGLHLVTTVATDVFTKLMELEDTVIFFDEMESLMQRRGGDATSFEQQFLTTTFIPKLQELAERAACLFFVATNHYDVIDPAAKRPGRFDFRLQILPPAYDEKLRMAKKILGGDYERIEAELRREAYAQRITLATRPEMMRLLKDLKHQPERAEQLLSIFQAELMDNVDELEEESQYNSFERRA